MKKIIFLLAMLQASLLSAAGNDLVMMQRLPDDSSAINRIVTKPAGTSDGVLGYLGSTQRPYFIQLGQGLQLNSGVLSSTVTVGPTGPQGPKGDPGVAGPVGPKGDAGPAGAQGLAGAPGLKGEQGIQGVAGPAGANGVQGAKGDTGSQGPQGVAGPKGDTGSAGAKGDQGPAGIQGAKGDIGLTGPQGAQGAQGVAGEKGDKGDQGSQGIQGIQGPIGLTGNSGPAGPTGLTGATGPVGATGPQGIQGPTGLTGPQGLSGAAAPAPTATVATRTLNTAFQPSATRPVLVSYAVDVSVTSLLLTGTQGTVALQYADNAGMTTNLVTVDGGTNSTGGVLNVTNTGTVKLVALIPVGKYVRITTTTNAGTPAFTYRAGNETSL